MRLLHVTDACGDRDSLCHCPQEALDRGKWVHAWTDAHDKAVLSSPAAVAAFEAQAAAMLALPGEAGDKARAWWGFVESWRECLLVTGAYCIASEVPVGGAGLGWIGTLDSVVRHGVCNEIWDKKCGPPESWHARQLAAYEYGWRVKCHGKRGETMKPLRRRSVHLQANGSFDPARHLVEYKGRDDYRDYLAYLRVAYCEINEGRREWPAKREGEE